jgi:acetyl esterase/lipase
MSQLCSSSLLTRQPGKGLWTFATLVVLPAHLLFLLLYNVPHFLRANPKWTYHQAVGKAVFALWWRYASVVEYHPTKTLEPGADGARFIVMQPATSDIYRGILAADPVVRPVPIGGMWYPRPYDPDIDADKKIAVHFHGGAYVLGGCRPMEGGWGPDVLARQLSGLVLQPQYRLAMNTGSRFPAAIQDGLTAYAYLLAQGVAPSNIVLSGESAGGNLVAVVLWFLAEYDTTLPRLRAALLWSPWLDLTLSPDALEAHRNAATDYLSGKLVEWAVRMYVPPYVGAGHGYISPLRNEFATQVPIFLQTGSSEVLHDDHITFVERMRGVGGNNVELMEIRDAPHDTFGAGMVLGFASQAEDAAAKAARFVEDVEVQR